jgi:hypothetical protein
MRDRDMQYYSIVQGLPKGETKLLLLLNLLDTGITKY